MLLERGPWSCGCWLLSLWRSWTAVAVRCPLCWPMCPARCLGGLERFAPLSGTAWPPGCSCGVLVSPQRRGVACPAAECGPGQAKRRGHHGPQAPYPGLTHTRPLQLPQAQPRGRVNTWWLRLWARVLFSWWGWGPARFPAFPSTRRARSLRRTQIFIPQQLGPPWNPPHLEIGGG